MYIFYYFDNNQIVDTGEQALEEREQRMAQPIVKSVATR
jgi:hypothetical protein